MGDPRPICISILALLSFVPGALALDWSPTAGPGSVGINFLYERDGTVYAGSMTDGVFRSTNNGATWSAANTGLSGTSITSLTANASFLFAGAQLDDFGHGGVYRSSDQGTSWTPVNNGIQGQSILSVLASGSFVLAGDAINGAYKSTNNGQSWFLSNVGLGQNAVTGMVQNGSTIFAIAYQGMFRTTDGGATWALIPETEFRSFFGIATSGSNIYAGAFDGLARSTDGGANWSFIEVLNLPSFVRLTSFAASGTTVYAGTAGAPSAGVIKSTDNGSNWLQANAGIEIAHVNALLLRSGRLLAGTPQKSMLASDDAAATWHPSRDGLSPGGNIRALFQTSGSLLLTGTGGDGIYGTTNQGNTWLQMSDDPGGRLQNEIVSSFAERGGVLFAGTLFDGVYRSADGAANWQLASNGLPAQDPFVFDLTVSGPNIIASLDQGIFYSSSGGASWLPSNITGGGFGLASADGFAYAIVVTGFFTTTGIYRSANDGVSWSMVFQAGGSTLESIAAEGSNVYVGDLLDGMFRSTDHGVSWQSISIGPDIGVFSILSRSPDLYAGSDVGSQQVYKSTNAGGQWTAINSGLPVNTAVEALGSDTVYLFAGTNERAVWRRPLSETAGVVEAGGSPARLRLELLGPNPFSSTTSIGFSIPETTPVALAIYDTAGRKVRTLVDTVLNPGSYTRAVDGGGLSAGVYFYRLSAGDLVATGKMARVKE